MGRNELRAASEERTPTYKGYNDNNLKLSGNIKKIPSNYDNHIGSSSSANSPLISRKSSVIQQNKIWGKSSTSQNVKQKQFNTIAANSREKSPFLYDRRLNKSFETANGLLCDNTKCQSDKSIKNTLFRRSSTPQLHYDANSRDSISSSWCCGNFVLKQWKKMHQQY